MAIVFECLSLKGLRLAHLRQLLIYIEEREKEMYYYGCKNQFEKRHKELKDWIQSAVKYSEKSDVVFPK